MADTTSEKKSERMEVRLGFSEKQAFVEACDTQGDTPSSALRRFISGYTKRADGELMGEAKRRLLRRYGVGLAGGAVLLAAVIATAISWPNKLGSGLTDSEVFTARDVDNNGSLILAKHKLLPYPDGTANGVLRVLDLDQSGTLSEAEFRAEGRMVYAMNSSGDSILGQEGEPVSMTFVDLLFTPARTRVSTYADARINAGELHRAVIWYDDGTNSVFEGDVGITTKSDGSVTFTSDVATFPKSVTLSEPEDGTVTATRGQ